MNDKLEVRIYHNIAIAMGTVLLALICWIGSNVAHIPVIDEQIRQLKDMVQEIVNVQIADHETRIRKLEDERKK